MGGYCLKAEEIIQRKNIKEGLSLVEKYEESKLRRERRSAGYRLFLALLVVCWCYSVYGKTMMVKFDVF